MEYSQNGTARSYTGNTTSATWVTVSESDLSSGSSLVARYSYLMGDLAVVRTDSWEQSGKVVVVDWSFTNAGSNAITNLRVMHSLEPDQDYDSYNASFGPDSQLTYNDVLDLNGDGTADWVQSVGTYSGWTIGYGLCEAGTEGGGHTLNWSSDADVALTDFNGADADAAMHWRHSVGTLSVGTTSAFSMVVAWDTTESAAQNQFEDYAPDCGLCDWDGDGVSALSCGGTDCDDFDASVAGTGTWYRDADGDGYGDSGTSVSACGRPVGYVANAQDCNDGNSAIRPNATESCNGVDDDCDSAVDEAGASGAGSWYQDADGDGYGDGAATVSCTAPTGFVSNNTDCDDGDGAVSPAATERCNGIDDDCDGSADEAGSAGEGSWYQDSDGDGYGDGAATVSCTAPAGYVSSNTDCDDGDGAVSPAATERCNGIDDDCDGSTDEAGSLGEGSWYQDSDGDGYGDGVATVSCTAPSGYVADNTDCDDSDGAVSPSATELCNGIDDDCDGAVDESTAADATVWYQDSDSDGYGSGLTQVSCDQPTGYVSGDGDCDESSGAIRPGAAELCNGVDDDCDGQIDDGAAGTQTWYRDADQDGEGDPSVSSVACGQPSGYVGNDDDCDDSDAAINTSATEVADGVDNDCDGTVDEGQVADTDGDGLTDVEEAALGTDPEQSDTDGDGLADGAEVNSHGTNPVVADTDEDGLTDGEEVNSHGTDPLRADTDGDGSSDGEEVADGTDPLVAEEVKTGTWYQGGVACSSGPSTTGAWTPLGLAALGLVLRRRRR